MSRTSTLLVALAAATALQAQTTAMDFTANDCDGNAHQLFSELEAGNAVIIDFVMMGCMPCVTASHGITDDILPNVADPSRVKFYSIGFSNSVTCSQISSWKSTNGFTHPVFAGMSAQVTYYGGFGMPTIVVLGGGSAHSVYYSHQGYSSAENTNITQAINDALAGSAGIEDLSGEHITVVPNPTENMVRVDDARWTKGYVLDVQGRRVPSPALNKGTLDVSALPAGLYLLRLEDAQGNRAIARFEKR